MHWPRPTAIHQLLPSFKIQDAIGNEVVLIQQALRRMGFLSEIFADMGDAHRPPGSLQVFKGDVFLLYHFSISSGLLARLAPWDGCKLIRYHSVTPPEFFSGGGEFHAREACRLGLRQMPMAGVIASQVLATSSFCAQEIAPYCQSAPTVIPVFRDYGLLSHTKQTSTSNSLLPQSKKQMLLFVGRIAPNKCQHDLLQLLYLAKKHISTDLQLILVGSFFSDQYRKKLEDLALALGLSFVRDKPDSAADVLIYSQLSDEEMAGLYEMATVFVCMSEHEGFGVPIVEAMHFGLPVMAAAETAIPETVGDAGVLFKKGDWPGILAALQAILFDPEVRAELQSRMVTRRATLDLNHSTQLFLNLIEKMIQPKLPPAAYKPK